MKRSHRDNTKLNQYISPYPRQRPRCARSAAFSADGGTDYAFTQFFGDGPGYAYVYAVDVTNQEASWSNYGSWCDMAAPGDNVFSTYLNGGTAYRSGTSMSTPHVAGSAALVRA